MNVQSREKKEHAQGSYPLTRGKGFTTGTDCGKILVRKKRTPSGTGPRKRKKMMSSVNGEYRETPTKKEILNHEKNKGICECSPLTTKGSINETNQAVLSKEKRACLGGVPKKARDDIIVRRKAPLREEGNS